MAAGLVVPVTAARYGRIRLLVGISVVSFVVGYLVVAVRPLLVGILHQASGGWTVPLVLVLASAARGGRRRRDGEAPFRRGRSPGTLNGGGAGRGVDAHPRGG
ncbi:hypothetical protein [Agromyces sp. NPDC058064]|uniref:hypothetical protein n=1 Tax=Agromyces sp. NPDC058064 TaxID=3346322 RepID=UPI0036DC0B85